MDIPGALDALVVDHLSGTVFAASGAADLEGSAPALRESLRATMDALAQSSPTGAARVEDLIVVTDVGYHLMRPVEMPFAGPLVFYVRLDLAQGDLTRARDSLREITGRMSG
ncbi:roadblock/LC7 domain-containing protein [Nonomuraea longicatena]